MQRIVSVFRVLFPLALSVMPGWGHIWVRRYNRGLSIFLIFFTIANGWLLLYLNARTGEYEDLVRLCQAALAGLFVFTIVDILRLTIWLQGKTVKARRRGQYRRSLVHYLRGEFELAEEEARRMIRTDPLDTSALLVLGMIQREAGEPRRAIKTFRRALRGATTPDWNEDLKREIDATRTLVS